MNSVQSIVFRRFLSVFGEPKTANPEAMFEEYERALSGNKDEVLHRAVDMLFKKSKFRSWPTIGECVDAVRAAAAIKSGQNKAERPFEERYPEWSTQAFDVADRMVKCALGKQALNEGWLLGLHEFCRRERRYPGPAEQRNIIRQTRVIDDCAAGKADSGVMHQSLQKLAQSFVVRRNELVERLGPEIKNLEIAA